MNRRKKRVKTVRRAGRENKKGEMGTVITERIMRAREHLTQVFGDGIRHTFDQHIHPLIQKGIETNVITPENLERELEGKGEHWHNLLLVDLCLWHLFVDQNNLPYHLLTNPKTGKYDGYHIAEFLKAHQTFCRLRELDNEPMFNGQAYNKVLMSEERLPYLVLLARILDLSALNDENIFAYVKGRTGNLEIIVPSMDNWKDTKRNIAVSILGFYASAGELYGFAPLVRDLKDFAVRTLYPGIWAYVENEMERLKEKIEASNKVMERIKKDLGKKLKLAGIDAEIKLREKGKSFGSAGLKAKKRFEENVLIKRLEEVGIDPSTILVDVMEPRTSKLGQNPDSGKGFTLAVHGTCAEAKIHGSFMTLEIGDVGMTIPCKIPGSKGYLFHDLDDQNVARDLSAGTIIIKSYKGSDRKVHLIQTAKRVGDLLPGCIRRALKKEDITDYSVEITDHIARPKANGYQSAHYDTVPREGNLVPFEWIVRTMEMHRYAELGGAAHAIYKEPAKSARPILKRIRQLMTLMTGDVSNRKIDTRNLKTHKLTIFDDKKIEFEALDGMVIINAIVDAGIELKDIKCVKVRGKKSNVKLTGTIKGPMEIVIEKAGDKDERMITPHLAGVILRNGHGLGEITMRQLRELRNNRG